LSGGYNRYASFTPDFIRQVGEERGKIVVTTSGRGPGVPYDDQAELDLFEAWADAAVHYDIDSDRVTIGGYSMGGIGTHRIASKWPDLFAEGFSIVGSLGGPRTDEAFGEDLYKNQELIAINQRHVPLLIWQGTNDYLAPYPLVLKYEQVLNDLGLRHEFDTFPGYEHLTFGYRDEWGPGAAFLDDTTVTRAPPRITYRRVPHLDNNDLGLIHDQVYWISDIAVGDGADHGLVDVRSLGFGEAEPIVQRYRREGTEPAPHIERGVEWEEPLSDPPPRNALDLALEDVSSVTVWVEEANLDPDREITVTVTSTIPATITLACSAKRVDVNVSAGETETTVPPCGQQGSASPSDGHRTTIDVTNDGNRARDPDDDGRYEDVNGDGEANVVDAQALFAHRDDPAVQSNPGAFDLNRDDEFDVVDVQSLFNQLK
jgi:dienelactone hydrolase